MRVAKWGVNRMPLIDRAWKANVNIWKRHQNLQSVFNHGECMMNADQNVDWHVVDQNVDQISREIAFVPLGGRIKSKYSSCMQFIIIIIIFYEYKTCLPEVKKIWRFWSCVSEDQMFWVLDMFKEDWGFLGFGSCFQRTKVLNLGSCF